MQNQRKAPNNRCSSHSESDFHTDEDDNSDDCINPLPLNHCKSAILNSPEESNKLPLHIQLEICKHIEASGGLQVATFKRLARYNPQFYKPFQCNPREKKKIYNRIGYWKERPLIYSNIVNRCIINNSNATANLSSSPLNKLTLFPSFLSNESHIAMSDYVSISTVRAEIQSKNLLTPGFDINDVGKC
jgi:hypothetical protein